MREIKFRGQRQSDNEWIFGDLLQPTELDNIYEISDCESIDGSRYDVIKATIGQYTGLHDKNGVEIYEGDIVKAKFFEKYITGKIEFVLGAFFVTGSAVSDNQMFIFNDFEVIGNIYDNPELLEEK